MSELRILITGSRDWADQDAIANALTETAARLLPTDHYRPVTLVHGAARGADTLAAEVAEFLGWGIESYPQHRFAGPKVRNRHMVDLGADICLAFATTWPSGTGHCARLARKAGIPVIDRGVSTRIEDRP